ncbi:P-type conjugative transfer ATPase TrbB [Luteibacter aegosomatis]|uniref:P-type conjugative transfer ATPase TrbB n=1 Tax=Luteibacter aegosomatis TaxID=2911537 RepID=UPI001FFABA73|nr:P-type conjugative transfer ATPase TrbB [Luteibacter aegosomatis]UPG85909.1 P-type conjugative transfer ATPase TrbB [Luteibacter aegosomatis]
MESQFSGGLSAVTRERARDKLRRDLGDVFLEAFNDPKTVEIMLNADHRLWQERLGEGMRCIGTMRPSQSEAVIKTTAGYYGKEITRSNPVLETEFPLDGSRFAAQLPPIVSAPTFALRKKAISIFSLEDYVASEVMTEAQRRVIVDAIRAHRNILVIGGTGSGKTTLVNAIIRGMVETDARDRVFIIEDTGEIQCAADNFVQYRTSCEVSMTQLLRTTLRMRPDRILVGEVRGPEALDLLMAWNTGHEGGAATLHANDARAGLSRLSLLVSMHRDAPNPIEPLIAEAVHVIVHISRTPHGRRVQEVLAVDGYGKSGFITKRL